jgi:hypothetical protein
MSRPPNDAEIEAVQKDPPELPEGVSREPWTAWKDARLTRNTLLRLDDHVNFAETHSGVRTAILNIIVILLEEAQSRFRGKEKRAPKKEITSSTEEGWLTANLTHENVEKSEGVIDALYYACPPDTPVHEMSSPKYGALGLEAKRSKTTEEQIDGVKVYKQYVPLGKARAVDLQVRDRCHASAKNKAERILFLAVVGPFIYRGIRVWGWQRVFENSRSMGVSYTAGCACFSALRIYQKFFRVAKIHGAMSNKVRFSSQF